MAGTVIEKILKNHIVEGTAKAGAEVSLRIDSTLTQDATGTMAYLQFEAIGIDYVKTESSVSFVDHNTLQTDFKNADDHLYLQSVAEKYGIYFSKPGNGICHQLYLERFAKPGKTLIGSDSHTPTAGGMCCFAMGAGGLDVAAVMGGSPFSIKYPKIVGVKLTGNLPDWVSAKDVILEVLRRLDVNGGVGKVLEYFGPGVANLSVTDRATITNMGTETGCTTSIFPSDMVTKNYLKAQGREEAWVEILPDKDAVYDEIIEIDLSTLEPLIALPHSPGNVKPVREVAGLKVDQVAIGSCTNSSLRDLKVVANILKEKNCGEKPFFGNQPRFKAGCGASDRQRRNEVHDQSGRKDTGKCMRTMHRDGIGSLLGRYLFKDIQQKFRRQERHEGCECIPRKPRGCRSDRAYRHDNGSENAG